MWSVSSLGRSKGPEGVGVKEASMLICIESPEQAVIEPLYEQMLLFDTQTKEPVHKPAVFTAIPIEAIENGKRDFAMTGRSTRSYGECMIVIETMTCMTRCNNILKQKDALDCFQATLSLNSCVRTRIAADSLAIRFTGARKSYSVP